MATWRDKGLTRFQMIGFFGAKKYILLGHPVGTRKTAPRLQIDGLVTK